MVVSPFVEDVEIGCRITPDPPCADADRPLLLRRLAKDDEEPGEVEEDELLGRLVMVVVLTAMVTNIVLVLPNSR